MGGLQRLDVSILAQLLLAPAVWAQTPVNVAGCCDVTNQLTPGRPVSSSVNPGAYTEFYFIGENEGDSFVVEVAAQTTSPAALGVYLYDAKPVVSAPEDPTPLADRCFVCQPNQQGQLAPISSMSVASISTFHAANAAPPTSPDAIDMDTVSHIGNTTHRRFFAYIGTCYHMAGSVYYVSVYGEAPVTVSFTVTLQRVVSAVPVARATGGPSVNGSVCDGKYVHYYVDWPIVTPGGMLATVQKTSGELSSFSVRQEQCGGERTENLLGPINLRGYGRSEGRVALPGSGHPLHVGRYYFTIRGSVDMCGEYTVRVRNLTQHEFHSAV